MRRRSRLTWEAWDAMSTTSCPSSSPAASTWPWPSSSGTWRTSPPRCPAPTSSRSRSPWSRAAPGWPGSRRGYRHSSAASAPTSCTRPTTPSRPCTRYPWSSPSTTPRSSPTRRRTHPSSRSSSPAPSAGPCAGPMHSSCPHRPLATRPSSTSEATPNASTSPTTAWTPPCSTRLTTPNGPAWPPPSDWRAGATSASWGPWSPARTFPTWCAPGSTSSVTVRTPRPWSWPADPGGTRTLSPPWLRYPGT